VRMDIRIVEEKNVFKYRVSCIIIKDGKTMLVKMNSNDFLCCSGGHVHIGESAEEAVIRETKEETEIKAKGGRLIGIVENFYTNERIGKKFHELNFYYILDIEKIPAEKLKDYNFLEHDEGKLVDLKFQWIPLDKIDNYEIKPIALKKILQNLDAKFLHFIVRDEKIIEEKIM